MSSESGSLAALIDSAPYYESADNTARFQFHCTGGVDCDFLYSLDGEKWTEFLPENDKAKANNNVHTLQLRSLDDGLHKLSLFACPLGSVRCKPFLAGVVSYEWTVNSSAPQSSIAAFPDSLVPSKFSFVTSKPHCTFRCNVDNEGWSPCDAESSFQLPDGVHNISVMAIDAAGRRDVNMPFHSWEVSTLDTIVQYCPIGALYSNKTQFNIEALYNGKACRGTGIECWVNYSITRESRLKPMDCIYATERNFTDYMEYGNDSISVNCKEKLLTGPPVNCPHDSVQVYFDESRNCTITSILNGTMEDRQGTMLLEGLPPGQYEFKAQTHDRYSNVDSTPSLCAWSINLFDDESQSNTDISLHIEIPIHPPALLTDSGNQTIFLMFNVTGGDITNEGVELQYLLEGPGTNQVWLNVPRMTVKDWFKMFDSEPLTMIVTPSAEALRKGNLNDFVWGLKFVSSSDGFFSLQVRDTISNKAVSASWLVDTERPIIFIKSTPQSPSHSKSAVVEFSCSEIDCWAEYKIDNEIAFQEVESLEMQPSYTKSGDSSFSNFIVHLNDLLAGNHTLSIRAYDVSQIYSELFTVQWTVDLTKPETFINESPPLVTAEQSANFTFECFLGGVIPKDGCGYEYQLLHQPLQRGGSTSNPPFKVPPDGDWYPTQTPVILYSMIEGYYLLRVRAFVVDKDDDEIRIYDVVPATVSWTRDATAPIVKWVVTPEKVSHQHRTTLFIFECIDNYYQMSNSQMSSDTSLINFQGQNGGRVGSFGCSFERSIDNGWWRPCSDWVIFESEGLTNGSHSLGIRATDAAENVSPVLSMTWVVDNTLPDTVIIAAPPSSTASTSAFFSLEDTVGKDGYFEWKLDNSINWNRTADLQVSLPGLSEGDHTFTIRSVRNEFKVDAIPVTYHWTVDTTCPDTDIVVSPENVTHLRSAIFVFQGSEPGVTFEYQLNSTSLSVDNSTSYQWLPTFDNTSMLQLYDLPEGMHVIRARAIDSAGNIDLSPAVREWVVDRAGVYGPPSMPTKVVGSGSDMVAKVRWQRPSDDGGGVISKYVVVASTGYSDVNVNTIANVLPNKDGELPPTETVIYGLTNGLVYTFSVIAVNAYGFGIPSLGSNKVLMFDPTDPCGLLSCSDHGACFLREDSIGELTGFCQCRPGFSGPDCSIESEFTEIGMYSTAWGDCSMECGGGTRKRTMICAEFKQGVAVGSIANSTQCTFEGESSDSMSMLNSSSTSNDWNDGLLPGQVEGHSEQKEACRDVPCLSNFLQVSFTLEAFYKDVCFTVDAQDAFLNGLALEIIQALHITLPRIRDLNAAPTEKPNEVKVSFIVTPPVGPADQPVRVLHEQIQLQVSSSNSALRSRGTWARLIMPYTFQAKASTYLPSNMQVEFLAYDVIALLVVAGTLCLLFAGWGAWVTSRGSHSKLIGGYCDVEESNELDNQPFSDESSSSEEENYGWDDESEPNRSREAGNRWSWRLPIDWEMTAKLRETDRQEQQNEASTLTNENGNMHIQTGDNFEPVEIGPEVGFRSSPSGWLENTVQVSKSNQYEEVLNVQGPNQALV